MKPVTVKTNAGILQCRQVVREDMPPHYAGIDAWIEAHMGAASFKPAEIPVSSAWNDASLANIARELDIDALVKATCVGMGNPHVVFFVSKLPARAVLEMAGDKIKSIPLFMPHGVNLTIAEIGSTAIFSLVFERGAGMTKSCGTAACATGVAAVMLGYRKKNEEILVQQLQRQAEDLFVRWDKSNNQVFLTGPVKKEFEGDVYV